MREIHQALTACTTHRHFFERQKEYTSAHLNLAAATRMLLRGRPLLPKAASWCCQAALYVKRANKTHLCLLLLIGSR